ncbi:MAG: S41 family peptidase [Rhodospirillales bacterium]|nr:S41 family peptidase [Alphaproteobacteria bacterium]MCB9987386.1 S41 family peptidase [Rhodospirillales bacterium]USO07632.1 MAG: S41 family peptidase [Rhodospirillales bacterium]
MNRKTFFLLLAALFFAFAAPLCATAAETDAPAAAPADTAETYKMLKLFGEVFERVRGQYVDPKTDKQLIEYAISGMLSSLDPHSSYLNDEGFEDMKVQTRGSFGGLGIEVTMENGLVKVVSPIDDTPAFKAGIKAGDLVTHLDGKPVIGMTLNDAVDTMRGKVGTPITLTVRREGTAEPLKFKIVRDVIKIKSVRWSVYDNLGYIRITTFNAQTDTGLKAALEDIHKKLGDKLLGYVLDLRNNPGGLLDQAIAVADDFLDQGEIVSTRGRNEEDTKRDNATPGDLADGLPLVVLINGGSASASEIVAGALQDHRRAVLLGTKSFGKGSVQTIISLPGNTAIRLTTARYYTPSGRSIQAKGIEPDILVPQAKVENIDNADVGISEADLKGALANPQSGANTDKSAPVIKPEPTPDTTPSDKTEDGKDGKDGKDSKAKIPSVDHPELSDDYQLARAIDLLRGIALYDSQHAPEGAPDLVRDSHASADDVKGDAKPGDKAKGD